ncbi:MAG TPA: bacillithiol biosynthesis BshC, partial [Thermoanaerobaculia bacterium]|nr:bacillithiol biosynthesis BshC [Thermoanaerobaculia bacterium]
MPPEGNARVVPRHAVPGLNALARGVMDGDPAVAAFLPDPWTLDAIAARAREVLARFTPRKAGRADPALSDLAEGRSAGVLAGQQVGLLGGPLLTLVKALAAVDLAEELRARGPATPVFWCASEDHDLAEVTRFAVAGPEGVRDLGPDPAPLVANRRPVGALPIEVDVAALLTRSAEGIASPDDDAGQKLRSFHAGATFREAFVATLSWLVGDPALRFADAARVADKPDLVPLATRIVRERADVSRLLAERNAALEKAGY